MTACKSRSLSGVLIALAFLGNAGCGDDDSASPTPAPSQPPQAGFTMTAGPPALRTPTPTPFRTGGAPTTTATAAGTSGLATATGTPAESATAGPSRTATRTVPSGAQGLLRIGRVDGFAGELVSVDVSLDVGENVAIAGIQNDLQFDGDLIAVPAANGAPDCTRNASIGKEATVFAFQPPQCIPMVDCEGLRAIVFSFSNVEPIASGSQLYTCNVLIAANAEIGSVSAVHCLNARASTPDGEAIDIDCEDGEVVVGDEVVPTPTPTPTLTCAPAPSPTACPNGEPPFCNAPCFADCFCVPPTPTPTA